MIRRNPMRTCYLTALSLLISAPAFSAQSFVYVPVACDAPGCSAYLNVYDAFTTARVASIGMRPGPLGSIAMSRDGARVFFIQALPGGAIGVLSVIDTARNVIAMEVSIDPAARLAAGRDLSVVYAFIDTSTPFMPSGRIEAIDVTTGAVVRSLAASDGFVSGFAASPTDDRLFVAFNGQSGTGTPLSGVNAYDAATGAVTGLLADGFSVREQISVSPDGAFLFDAFASVNPGSVGAAIKAWDLSLFRTVAFQTPAAMRIGGIPGLQSFHSRRAYLSGGLGTIDVFDVDARAKLGSITASQVGSIAISGDDSRLWIAEGSVNPGWSVLQVVDTASGATVGSIPLIGYVGPIVSMPPVPLPPFGFVDTPTDNASGLSGAVALTGWALDDMGVTRVRIYRDPVAGEPAASQIYIGDGAFVDGARPDVQALYPTLPYASRAGWGLQVLTNMLPGQGNGTYRFSVYADDFEGLTTLLGTRMVTCANATATVPFGTIDTPAPGQTVSGTLINFGWAMTPQPDVIPFDGSTIDVLIDDVVVGHPTYGLARPDVDATFPGYQNTGHAVGYFVIDTTQLANGLHTIAWVVQDNVGNMQGIGSRFFTVANP
jgi:hypothetical protein